MRILLICDPHVDFDYRAKKRFFTRAERPEVDAIVCVGDVANDRWGAECFFQWFTGWDVPKYYVPGNHDLWWAKSWGRAAKPARDAGWKAPRGPYEVIDDMLFFNLWYVHFPFDPTDDPGKYNDFRNFDVDRYTMPNVSVEYPVDPPKVKASFSHMEPRLDLPNPWNPSYLYQNPKVDEIARAHGSPVHCYGHTHRRTAEEIEGVKYFNVPVGYQFEAWDGLVASASLGDLVIEL